MFPNFDPEKAGKEANDAKKDAGKGGGGKKPDYGNYTIRFYWRDFTKLFILSDKPFLVL